MRRTRTAITLCVLPFTSALSLADFQQVPRGVSLICAVTYDSQIPSCTKADFADGAACSETCIEGLEAINGAVDAACQGTEVSSATLLGMVFTGHMLGSFCPNTMTTTTATTTSQTTTITPPKPASTTSPETLESKSSTISSTSTTPIIVKTTSSTAATESTSATEQKTTSSISSSSPISTTSSSPISTTSLSTSKSTSSSSPTLAFDTTKPNAASIPTSTKPAATHQAHKSEQQIQIEALKDTGGGSPFDIVDSSARAQISDSRLILVALGITIGTFLAL